MLILTLAAGPAATSYEARVAAAERDAAQQLNCVPDETAAGRLKDSDVPGALASFSRLFAGGAHA